MFVKSLKFKFLAILLFFAVVYCVFTISKDQFMNGYSFESNMTSTISNTKKATSVTNRHLDTITDFKKINRKKDKQFTLAQTLRNVPKVKIEAIDCRALFVGSPLEIKKADKYHSSLKSVTYQPKIPSDLDECDSYLSEKEFAREPADDEEAAFSIAFSILVYKDFQQFEKLLRAIYRPQNYYCIHIDSKSELEFKNNIQALVNCFDNDYIFVSPISFDVKWATMTVLNPEIECMKELWKRFLVDITSSDSKEDEEINKKKNKKKPGWKYFINLTGQEFPLRTNLELVRILKIFNGSNNAEATRARMQDSALDYYNKWPAPGGLKIWKGSVHVVLTVEFVDFVLHDPIPGQLLEYLQFVWVPDEHFFSTLNNNYPNLTVPGGYTGKNSETESRFNRFIVRFKNWGSPPFAWPCKGKWVRQICHFGVRDLPLLASRDELFANKFDYSFQPLAYDCMEELLYNRTKMEYRSGFIRRKVKLHRRKSSAAAHFDFIDGEQVSTRKLNHSEIDRIIKENLRNKLNVSEGVFQNKDHIIFPDKTFYVYGDEQDGQYGQYDSEEGARSTSEYLSFVRPTIHEPGVVDFDHYKNLDFVQNHLTVPEDWTYEQDYQQISSKQDLDLPKNSTD